MISRYEVFLNGVSLGSVSPEISIIDIQYPQVTIRNESYALARRQGAHVVRRYIESLSVVVVFEIHAYDINERQAILSHVVRWAQNGGALQTNDRNGQMLKCICEQFPSVSSVRNWTDQLQITFSAHSLPFWQDVAPTRLTLSGTSGNDSVYIPGNVNGGFVEVTVTANNALTSVTLSAGDTEIQLSGLNIAAGGTIVISYDDDMIQSIKSGNNSLLPYRSGNDDLIVDCGKIVPFEFSSDADCSVEFRVRGLWL